jgi:hypothetical protein
MLSAINIRNRWNAQDDARQARYIASLQSVADEESIERDNATARFVSYLTHDFRAPVESCTQWMTETVHLLSEIMRIPSSQLLNKAEINFRFRILALTRAQIAIKKHSHSTCSYTQTHLFCLCFDLWQLQVQSASINLAYKKRKWL